MVRNDYPVDIAAKVISGGFCYVLQIQRLRGRWAEFASFQICWIKSPLSLTLWKFPHTNINTICIFSIAVFTVLTGSNKQCWNHWHIYIRTGAQTLICSFKKKSQYYCVCHCFSQTEKNLIKQLEDKHQESNNLFVKLEIKLTFTKYRYTMIIFSAGTIEFCPCVSCVAFHFLPLCDFQPFFCAHLLVESALVCIQSVVFPDVFVSSSCCVPLSLVPCFPLSPPVCSWFLFPAFRIPSLTSLLVCSLLLCCYNLFFGIFALLGLQISAWYYSSHFSPTAWAACIWVITNFAAPDNNSDVTTFIEMYDKPWKTNGGTLIAVIIWWCYFNAIYRVSRTLQVMTLTDSNRLIFI